jgi:ABC-type multidrug transport system permease subunit
MQPEQPQQSAQPQATVAPLMQPVVAHSPSVNYRKRTISALQLIIVPTALLLVAIALNAISNYFLSDISGDSDMFGNRNSLQGGVNTLALFVGVIAAIAWLPSLITGIVLLATRKK